jgi:hypothetical protein
MKRSIFAVTVALAFTLGLSSSASADGTIELQWLSTTGPGVPGTSAITGASGDQLTLGIFVTAGTEGMSVYGISISFDGVGFNQLDLNPPDERSAATEFGLKPTVTCLPFPACFFGSPTMAPFTPGVAGVVESNGLNTGFVYTFEAGTLGNGLLASFGAFKIGEINFTVNSSVANNGEDVFSGFFNAGIDGAYDNFSTEVTMSFGSATVDTFGPEPGTSVLLGVGLVGLVMAGRRNRS